ncbi:MarR family winged helix-turn-helix transcriptional regulator [Streptacidiphilus cavernicola]|uniref:MarR family winged helix-turn-helix transcriptional regulator n=1 Tax=Streptacidiphilus cavernicola TaxID=3342716 RepID=A0ABV6VQ09_9ACTN
MPNTAAQEPGPTEEEIQAFQRATRDLIGVALHSLDAAGQGVSLAQMRVLLALRDLGRCPSSKVARALGLGPSSVTRLAERLVASGHVVRGTDAHHRSMVTLELTDRGTTVVQGVLAWRHAEFARILSQIDPVLREHAARALSQFHTVVGEAYASELPGPMPL